MRSPNRSPFQDPDSLGKLGFWVFVGFGGATTLGGVVLTFQDPAGPALIAFGLVFVGAGFMARRLFTAPDGKKSIIVEEDVFQARRLDGQSASLASGVVIHVDADAGPEEIAAAKAAWTTAQYAAARPDWATGRIVAEGDRRRGMFVMAAIVWTVFASCALAAALIWGDVAWFVLVGAAPIAVLLATKAVSGAARRPKLGQSQLLMRNPPARLGDVVEGDVQTSLPLDRMPRNGFQIELACIRRWGERRSDANANRPRTAFRSETLWRDAASAKPAGGENGGLKAPVRFQLAETAPHSTLGQESAGIVWELSVAADMDGRDYRARFIAPVLDPATRV
mgnify:CR=1 FL=1